MSHYYGNQPNNLLDNHFALEHQRFHYDQEVQSVQEYRSVHQYLLFPRVMTHHVISVTEETEYVSNRRPLRSNIPYWSL